MENRQINKAIKGYTREFLVLHRTIAGGNFIFVSFDSISMDRRRPNARRKNVRTAPHGINHLGSFVQLKCKSRVSSVHARVSRAYTLLARGVGRVERRHDLIDDSVCSLLGAKRDSSFSTNRFSPVRSYRQRRFFFFFFFCTRVPRP